MQEFRNGFSYDLTLMICSELFFSQTEFRLLKTRNPYNLRSIVYIYIMTVNQNIKELNVNMKNGSKARVDKIKKGYRSKC